MKGSTRSRRVQRVSLATMACAGCLLAACANPDSVVGFQESDPAARIRAIREAAATDDQSAIPQLIGLLESDDPAERLLAIRSLEKITGQTNGYDHAAEREERQEAVQRWATWYAQHGGSTSAKGT